MIAGENVGFIEDIRGLWRLRGSKAHRLRDVFGRASCEPLRL
jgi:hypothetical protein